MSVVVDTGVLVAAMNERDAKHERVIALIEEIRQGRHGDALATDFMLDEVVTVTLARTGRHEKAVQAIDLILPREPDAAWILLEPIGEEAFFSAIGAFRSARRRELSLTDWTTVALVRAGRADAVVSFDEDFDGLVPRIGSRSGRVVRPTRVRTDHGRLPWRPPRKDASLNTSPR